MPAQDSPLSSITPSIHKTLTRVDHASTLIPYPEGQLRIPTMDRSRNSFLCEEYEANADGKTSRPSVEQSKIGSSLLPKTHLSAYSTQQLEFEPESEITGRWRLLSSSSTGERDQQDRHSAWVLQDMWDIMQNDYSYRTMTLSITAMGDDYRTTGDPKFKYGTHTRKWYRSQADQATRFNTRFMFMQ